MEQKVELTDEELLLLDGKVSPEIQTLIDNIRDRLLIEKKYSELSELEAKLIQDVVEEAKKTYLLIFQYKRLRHCSTCNKSAGYAVYKRSSRHHRKGEPNYDKPLTFLGVELAKRFITWQGHATLGCCDSCFKKLQPYLTTALVGFPVELPEELYAEGEFKYKAYRLAECTKCGWKGHEGQMGKSRTVMGNGFYPNTCPSCKSKNEILSSNPIVKIDYGKYVPVRIEERK